MFLVSEPVNAYMQMPKPYVLLCALAVPAFCDPIVLTTPIAISSYGNFGYSLGDQYAGITGSGSDGTDSVSFSFNSIPYGPALSIDGVNSDYPYNLGGASIDGINGIGAITLNFNGSTGYLRVYQQSVLAASAPIYTYLSSSSSVPTYYDGRLVEVDFGQFTTSTTPEPGSLLLGSCGFLTMLIVWRIKAQQPLRR